MLLCGLFFPPPTARYPGGRRFPRVPASGEAPQIPISQESGTATPCSCSTWAMVLSPGTGQRSPVEARGDGEGSVRRRRRRRGGRLERFAVQLRLLPSDRPRGIANPGHKSGRTAEVDPGVGVRSPRSCASRWRGLCPSSEQWIWQIPPVSWRAISVAKAASCARLT